jgi:hypothetical protein
MVRLPDLMSLPFSRFPLITSTTASTLLLLFRPTRPRASDILPSASSGAVTLIPSVAFVGTPLRSALAQTVTFRPFSVASFRDTRLVSEIVAVVLLIGVTRRIMTLLVSFSYGRTCMAILPSRTTLSRLVPSGTQTLLPVTFTALLSAVALIMSKYLGVGMGVAVATGVGTGTMRTFAGATERVSTAKAFEYPSPNRECLAYTLYLTS